MQLERIRMMRFFGCYGKLPVSLVSSVLDKNFALSRRVKEMLLIGDRFSITIRNALELSLMDTRPITTSFLETMTTGEAWGNFEGAHLQHIFLLNKL